MQLLLVRTELVGEKLEMGNTELKVIGKLLEIHSL